MSKQHGAIYRIVEVFLTGNLAPLLHLLVDDDAADRRTDGGET